MCEEITGGKLNKSLWCEAKDSFPTSVSAQHWHSFFFFYQQWLWLSGVTDHSLINSREQSKKIHIFIYSLWIFGQRVAEDHLDEWLIVKHRRHLMALLLNVIHIQWTFINVNIKSGDVFMATWMTVSSVCSYLFYFSSVLVHIQFLCV